MFKTAVSLEETGKTDIVALDKTGTITSGEPEVTDMVPAEGYSEEKLLLAALALEQKSEHPLAHAIVRLAQEKQITCDAVEEFEAVAGNGLTGTQKGVRLTGGNRKFIERSRQRLQKLQTAWQNREKHRCFLQRVRS